MKFKFHRKNGPLRMLTLVATSMVMLAMLAACKAAQSDAVLPVGGKSHALTIYGYNYTNRYIDQFYVDGQGGGNLDVSTPTAGGGKRVCCIGWTDGTPLPQTVHVRWMNAGCKKSVTNSSGETRQVAVPLFKEQEVTLIGPVPQEPHYFELHIYPDGHIEAAITETPSQPRLKLDPSRKDRAYPPCEEHSK